MSRDTGAWSGAWSPFSLAAALPIASSSISLSWVLGRLLPDPAQVLLHCVVAGELQGKGVCHLSVFLQKRKAELQAPGRAYTHPMNIFAWGSVTLNSKEKTLWQVQKEMVEKRKRKCLPVFWARHPTFSFYSWSPTRVIWPSLLTAFCLSCWGWVSGWEMWVYPHVSIENHSSVSRPKNLDSIGQLSTGIACWLYLSPRNILAKTPSNNDHV